MLREVERDDCLISENLKAPNKVGDLLPKENHPQSIGWAVPFTLLLILSACNFKILGKIQYSLAKTTMNEANTVISQLKFDLPILFEPKY